MAKISIVIPVYNVEKYLRECLDSVVNQTLDDIEIICVNDASTDNSLAILKEYSQRDSRIKIIDKDSNDGLGVTRNIGQKSAQGKYVLFLDSDDYIELDACEKLYAKIEKEKTDAVYFNVIRFIEETREEEPCIDVTDILGDKRWRVFDKFEDLVKLNRQVWFKMYNRAFLEENNILCSEERICEDSLFRLDFLLANPTVCAVNEFLFHYRIRKSSITFGKRTLPQNAGVLAVHNSCMQKIMCANITREQKKILFANQIWWVYGWTNSKKLSSKIRKENRKERLKSYEEFLKEFSFQELIDMKLKLAFWQDLTCIENFFFSIWYEYLDGYMFYKIKLLGIEFTFKKSEHTTLK